MFDFNICNLLKQSFFNFNSKVENISHLKFLLYDL